MPRHAPANLTLFLSQVRQIDLSSVIFVVGQTVVDLRSGQLRKAVGTQGVNGMFFRSPRRFHDFRQRSGSCCQDREVSAVAASPPGGNQSGPLLVIDGKLVRLSRRVVYAIDAKRRRSDRSVPRIVPSADVRAVQRRMARTSALTDIGDWFRIWSRCAHPPQSRLVRGSRFHALPDAS